MANDNKVPLGIETMAKVLTEKGFTLRPCKCPGNPFGQKAKKDSQPDVEITTSPYNFKIVKHRRIICQDYPYNLTRKLAEYEIA